MSDMLKDGRKTMTRDSDGDVMVLAEVRVFVAIGRGYFGTGLTASAAEASLKLAGGSVKGLRVGEGRMVLLPPGTTYFTIDGTGSVRFERGASNDSVSYLEYTSDGWAYNGSKA